ncbi:MAG: hypothetical protein GC149_01055 [Gammaproteobacteria bacterium]|nr:hypothetical protein [Gammaproteobacteria bacterium]
MRIQALLAFVTLNIALTGCAHRTKQVTVDAQCNRLITQAQELYQQKAQTLNQRIADAADNLITGAKIAMEHREFIPCLDKASRAIKLLDPDATVSVKNPQ